MLNGDDRASKDSNAVKSDVLDVDGIWQCQVGNVFYHENDGTYDAGMSPLERLPTELLVIILSYVPHRPRRLVVTATARPLNVLNIPLALSSATLRRRTYDILCRDFSNEIVLLDHTLTRQALSDWLTHAGPGAVASIRWLDIEPCFPMPKHWNQRPTFCWIALWHSQLLKYAKSGASCSIVKYTALINALNAVRQNNAGEHAFDTISLLTVWDAVQSLTAMEWRDCSSGL